LVAGSVDFAVEGSGGRSTDKLEIRTPTVSVAGFTQVISQSR
jgi:hypothetical protein